VLEKEKRDGKAGRVAQALMRMDPIILDERDCTLKSTEISEPSVFSASQPGMATATSSAAITAGEIEHNSSANPPCKNALDRAFLLPSSNPRNEWPKWRHYAENGWRLNAGN